MDYNTATIYGFIQGLTEFLPVSSSGHLALIPTFLSIQDPGVTFDLAMHVGTAFAVGIYFREDFFLMLRDSFSVLSHRPLQASSRQQKHWFFFCHLVLSTAVTVALALPLKSLAETYGRSPGFIAFNLAFFGLLMALADRVGTRKPIDHLQRGKDFSTAAIIGLAQVLALFPGVSRSGITITAARFLSLSREESSRFSFMLSLPLIVGGFGLKVVESLEGGLRFQPLMALYGLGISFLVGYLSIHYFLKFIRRVGLWGFALYRCLLAVLIFLYIL